MTRYVVKVCFLAGGFREFGFPAEYEAEAFVQSVLLADTVAFAERMWRRGSDPSAVARKLLPEAQS